MKSKIIGVVTFVKEGMVVDIHLVSTRVYVNSYPQINSSDAKILFDNTYPTTEQAIRIFHSLKDRMKKLGYEEQSIFALPL